MPVRVPIVPVCFKWRAAKQRQYGREEVEGSHQRDGEPNDSLVDFGEVKNQQPCADGPLEDCDTDDVDNLCYPEIVRVAHNIDRWVENVPSQAGINNDLVDSSRDDVEKL